MRTLEGRGSLVEAEHKADELRRKHAHRHRQMVEHAAEAAQVPGHRHRRTAAGSRSWRRARHPASRRHFLWPADDEEHRVPQQEPLASPVVGQLLGAKIDTTKPHTTACRSMASARTSSPHQTRRWAAAGLGTPTRPAYSNGESPPSPSSTHEKTFPRTPVHSAQTTPPLYPPAYHTSPQGGRSSRGGKRAKCGDEKRVHGASIAAVDQGPGEPAGRRLGVRLPMVCL